jgi:predicted small lipoprotein YifL
MKRPLILALTFAALNLLIGCGQSGPLYLPGNPSQIKAPQEAPQDEQQEKKQSEEEDGGAP